MFGRSWPVYPGSLQIAVLLWLVCGSTVAGATPAPRAALGGIVRDAALARVLGEALFRDTVDVMSASPSASQVTAPIAGASAQLREGDVAGQVARTLLAHRPLDKYLWLIQQAFDDSLWRGPDRSQIERNFPLIWRTSILLYESALDASPARVRVCAPNESGDGFDCRDEREPARLVPIPAQMSVFMPRDQPNMG